MRNASSNELIRASSEASGPVSRLVFAVHRIQPIELHPLDFARSLELLMYRTRA